MCLPTHPSSVPHICPSRESVFWRTGFGVKPLCAALLASCLPPSLHYPGSCYNNVRNSQLSKARGVQRAILFQARKCPVGLCSADLSQAQLGLPDTRLQVGSEDEWLCSRMQAGRDHLNTLFSQKRMKDREVTDTRKLIYAAG